MENIKVMLNEISEGISRFITNWLSDKENFNCRSFYGETFSLALLERSGALNDNIRFKLIHSYEQLDKENTQFHWEFNNYALLDYYQNSCDNNVKKYINDLRFKHTSCTNWTLLRSNVRLKAKIDTQIAIEQAKKKINRFQLSSGLVLDDPGVKSFQYHCFSIAMIGEIYEQTKDQVFLDSFLLGVSFIKHFILSNGETLYIGRGQNQSFGYGALLYILSLAYKFSGDRTFLGDMKKVENFILRFQRYDGSFPLVLNYVENNIPKVVDMQSEEYVGWYPYNNYFDYLPFMGLFIDKANKVLDSLDTSVIEYSADSEYRDSSFIKIVKSNYEAVISKNGGYWTNDMTIPYIVREKENLTPCYGGEQFQNSLYSEDGLALPFCDKLNKSIRYRSISFIRKNTLWVISPIGIMKRTYQFREDYISIRTRIFSLFKFRHVYLFFQDKDLLKNKYLKFVGYGYSASGKLKKYIDERRISEIRFEIES